MVSKTFTVEKHEGNIDNGLSVLSAAIFIAGEISGSGILAIPKAVVDADWCGFVYLILFCLNAGYAGTKLGICWTIVEERYPEYKCFSRAPYCIIAEKAVGRWGSLLIAGCMRFTLFGASVVYLLLASQIFQSLMQNLTPGITYCWWFLIFSIFITPPMWLGSPKDFWAVGIGALITTAAAAILLCIQTILDGIFNATPVIHEYHSFKEYFLAFGTIQFCFGGASAFPTIQNDMKQRDQFYKSAIIGFSVVLMMYLPIGVAGFVVFGNNVSNNLSLSLSSGIMVSVANLILALHLFFALLIVINPVCQGCEEFLNISQKFGFKRCFLRTMIVVFMVIVGETIPRFNKILSLVGGSTVTVTSFVMPYYFYMRLCNQKNKDWPERSISNFQRILMWVLIILGLLGGTATTYNALYDIFSPNTFTNPCYWPK
uniref:Amino acid transporter transmembrane domain-containing protein n=1 Tax=Clastoptera arizonana TaxID=38151 RepID=A0A1B6DU47_9HEMI